MQDKIRLQIRKQHVICPDVNGWTHYEPGLRTWTAHRPRGIFQQTDHVSHWTVSLFKDGKLYQVYKQTRFGAWRSLAWRMRFEQYKVDREILDRVCAQLGTSPKNLLARVKAIVDA